MKIDVEYNWDHQPGTVELTSETKYKERIVNHIRESLADINAYGTIFLGFFKKTAQEWGVKVQTEGFTIAVEVKILITIDIIVHHGWERAIPGTGITGF